MDRFIDYTPFREQHIYFYLKSNMDRFIGICLNMFMDFCGI